MSYQAIETSRFGFYDLYKEKIFFNNTDVSIFDGKGRYNDNVFPHGYDFYMKRKKTVLLNNSVFREYNQI